MRHEGQRPCGRLAAATTALHQRYADLLFKLLQVLRHRRLGQPQRPRRALKTACLNDRYQALQPDRIQHAAGSALGRRFAALIGRAPANTWMMFCAAQRSISRRTARTADPMCGVNSVFGCASSAGSISRGRSARAQSSISNTSAAYPPSWPRSSAASTAASSTTEPRQGFTSRAPGRTRASSSALTRCWVSAFKGSASRMKSELAKSSLHATGAGRAVARFVYPEPSPRGTAGSRPIPASAQPWPVRWRPCQGCRP